MQTRSIRLYIYTPARNLTCTSKHAYLAMHIVVANDGSTNKPPYYIS